MKPEVFGGQLRELEDIITYGIACLSAWYGIADLDDASAHALNRYRGFFLPAQRSLREMALLQFAKVFDRGPRAVSLPNLLRAARANPTLLVPHARGDDLRNLETQIASNDALRKRLTNYRNQRLAHHDREITRDTSLPYGEVTRLIEDVKDMYNSLSTWHGLAFISFAGISRTSECHTAELKRIVCEERDRAKS